jgi:hypothetical protein
MPSSRRGTASANRARLRGDRYTDFTLLFGEFHNQDAVFTEKSAQHHQTDLRIEIERQSGDADTDKGSKNTCDKRKQDRYGDGPTPAVMLFGLRRRRRDALNLAAGQTSCSHFSRAKRQRDVQGRVEKLAARIVN